tara:strand:- start:4061 stop:4321 length:261 start_codon:yes stop_codon:yes gene_type:complete
MKREELLLKAKEYRIKGIYKMKKTDLEYAIYLYECASWFNDIAGNNIAININDEEVEVDVIDLKKINLNDYKMWDIDMEKQLWLMS